MRITPLDIQQKQFPLKLRGFDVKEVYAFLEVIREEMDELFGENTSLKEQLHILENQAKEYRVMESTLIETLVTAQKIVEDYKGNARKGAELISKEAKLKADALIMEAQEKVVKIHEDIDNLKEIRIHFKEEVRGLTESHLRMLDFDGGSVAEETGVKEGLQKRIQDYQSTEKSLEEEQLSNDGYKNLIVALFGEKESST